MMLGGSQLPKPNSADASPPSRACARVFAAVPRAPCANRAWLAAHRRRQMRKETTLLNYIVALQVICAAHIAIIIASQCIG
eukprot:5208186-Pleurochrysis_carterae.AAC.3